MTEQQKAKELFDKYWNYFVTCHLYILHDKAKQCALIAVDELIKNSHSDKRTEYWENVKFEIRKL
jgi:hypothetical protein